MSCGGQAISRLRSYPGRSGFLDLHNRRIACAQFPTAASVGARYLRTDAAQPPTVAGVSHYTGELVEKVDSQRDCAISDFAALRGLRDTGYHPIRYGGH